MSDKSIAKPESTLPTNTTYIKDNTANNFNINNSKVVFNVNNPQQQSSASDVEKYLAQQRFTRDYYQLLVTCDSEVFDKKIISFPPDRALNQYNVPPEILERCSSLEKSGVDELKTFPALICIENTEFNAKTDPDQIAWFGYIKKVQKLSYQINVVFETIAPIHQSILCDQRNAIFFDLNMDGGITTLNRSAWYVRKTDIYEAFQEAGIDYIKPV